MADRIPKFNIGDVVKVVRYGHVLWAAGEEDKKRMAKTGRFKLIQEIDNVEYWDVSPELVGRTGTIDNISITQNVPSYSVSGIPEKHAWYVESQLELVDTEVN